MRRLLLAAAATALAPAAGAEIRSADACQPAIAADAAAAREDAAQWARLGGGVPARLCEAAALEALGAGESAARLLTALAQNTNRAMTPELRTTIFEDAAHLWGETGRPDLARAALASADALTPPGPARLIARARAEAAARDWPAARESLEAALAQAPEDAQAQALHAATLRRTGEPTAALAAAERARALDPALAEALFEAAAAQAELGGRAEAAALWLELIAAHPQSALASLAARNLQTLASEDAAPAEAQELRPLSPPRAVAPPPRRPRPAPPDPDRRPAPRP